MKSWDCYKHMGIFCQKLEGKLQKLGKQVANCGHITVILQLIVNVSQFPGA